MPIADTLLRLAEEPAFFTPKWSPHIIEELQRTLKGKLGRSQAQTERRIETMKLFFPDAMVAGYEGLIASMTNDPKDRHVVAAAVRCGAHAIVSDNVKHFPKESLAAYGLECLTADGFLVHQYHLNPDAFIEVLVQQASDIGCSLSQLISKHVPSLSTLIIAR
jgi:predicted nucleic acid-binding protein